MDIMYEKERQARNHYKNVNYFEIDKGFINAAMPRNTFLKIFKDLNIDVNNINNCLDIGCGCGHTLLELLRLNSKLNCVGVDYSVERIRVADQLLSDYHDNVILKIEDINKMVENDNVKYDLIIAFEVLEHLVDPENVMKLIKENLLNNGGMLICTIPFQDKPNDIHLSSFKNNDDVIKKLKVSPLNKNYNMRFPNQHVFYYKNLNFS